MNARSYFSKKEQSLLSYCRSQQTSVMAKGDYNCNTYVNNSFRTFSFFAIFDILANLQDQAGWSTGRQL